MTKILLVRHGHVEGIEPERFRGRAELVLTDRGRGEAEAIARRIASEWQPSVVYTSPMGRCIDTGAAIARACQVVLDELSDIDYGTWQSASFDEKRKFDPELFAAWLATPHLIRFPDGESLPDLAARTADALRLIMAHHRHDTVVVVGHDSMNRVLLMQLLDQPLSAYWRLAQSPCCLNEIDLVNAHVRILRINETCHLRARET